MDSPVQRNSSSSDPQSIPLGMPSIEGLRSELAAADSKKRYIFRSAAVTVSLAVVALLGGAALFFVAPAISVVLLVGSTIFGIIGLVQFVRYVSCSDEAEKLRKKIPLTPEEKEKKEKENLALQLVHALEYLKAKYAQLTNVYNSHAAQIDIKGKKHAELLNSVQKNYNRGIRKLRAPDTNKKEKSALHTVLTNIYEQTKKINEIIQKLFTDQESSAIQTLQFSLEPVPPLPINAPSTQELLNS
jgi:hypothetical protein